MAHSTLAPLVLTFHDIDASMLAPVGGKAANLGELTRVGLPVPLGFCITTTAYAQVTSEAGLEPILDQLASIQTSDSVQLANCAAAARSKLLAIAMPDEIVEAVTQAYQAFASGAPIPVAVRSSATAEDLPFASFAGQQDTYLNIVGAKAVLDAVKRCWASLWTERAVNYRQHLGIDHRSVHLAVVVQQMVDVAVAGVLFTANPLTGRRKQAVIDANPGLGEAVVSGAVNPDHFVVNTTTGEIIERRLGDKRIVIQATAGGGTQQIERSDQSKESCLSDAQIHSLVKLGAQVEAHYGVPQDTEWAIDTTGQLWLTQARPITTLYPLPENVSAIDSILRVYFSANVAQGVYRPFTPMGIQTFGLFGSSLATFIGYPPRNILEGSRLMVEAGGRLFIDITLPLRNAVGRRLLLFVMHHMEARSAPILRQLITDPRLSLLPSSRWTLIRTLLRILVKARIPLYVLQAVLRPNVARARIARLEKQLRHIGEPSTSLSAVERIARIEQLPFNMVPHIMASIASAFGAGLFCLTLAGKLLGNAATADERQVLLRGLPYNPTTEMDLALWRLAQHLRDDAPSVQAFQNKSSEQLAHEYRQSVLPPVMQEGLFQFLHIYGHRAVAEIDLGLSRWSEDPTHILGVLANYLQLTNPALAPDVQFKRSAQEADAMLLELTRRATRRGWLRGLLVRFLLKRGRALAGLREMPKYFLVLLMARMRELLRPVGEQLAQDKRLETAEDIFFLTLTDARSALSGTDYRTIVKERHAIYEQELRRRHVPRVLLSDGTEPEVSMPQTTSIDGALHGTPASAGSVTDKARVILEPTGAHLEPGEILVAPSTDPGWTPLFLTAGGLVMEMGGAMSHGAVVAREYGIPAVVGVAGATEHITTGQMITVDGSSGTVIVTD